MPWGEGTTLVGKEGPKGEQGPKGDEGAEGEDGRTVLNGEGPPAEGLGAVGDFYIDTLNHKIYGPKT